MADQLLPDDYEPLPSIHPPSLILFDPKEQEELAMLEPPSPLSTPPNTPKRRITSSSESPVKDRQGGGEDDHDEEDKNDLVKQEELSSNNYWKPEIMPFDEGIDEVMSNGSNNNKKLSFRRRVVVPFLKEESKCGGEQHEPPKITMHSSPPKADEDEDEEDEPGVLRPRTLSSPSNSRKGAASPPALEIGPSDEGAVPEVEASSNSSDGSGAEHQKRWSRPKGQRTASNSQRRHPSAAETVPSSGTPSEPFDEGRDEIFALDDTKKKTSNNNTTSRRFSRDSMSLPTTSPVSTRRSTKESKRPSASPTRSTDSRSPSRGGPALAFFPTQAVTHEKKKMVEDLKPQKVATSSRSKPSEEIAPVKIKRRASSGGKKEKQKEESSKEEGTIGTILDDAAYFSRAAATTLSTVEDLLLGPAVAEYDDDISGSLWKGKTPDEMVAEWKQHRRRLSVQSMSPPQSPQQGCDTDDDRTEILSNSPTRNPRATSQKSPVGLVVTKKGTQRGGEGKNEEKTRGKSQSKADDPILKFRSMDVEIEGGDVEFAASNAVGDGIAEVPPLSLPTPADESASADASDGESHSDESSVPPPPPPATEGLLNVAVPEKRDPSDSGRPVLSMSPKPVSRPQVEKAPVEKVEGHLSAGTSDNISSMKKDNSPPATKVSRPSPLEVQKRGDSAKGSDESDQMLEKKNDTTIDPAIASQKASPKAKPALVRPLDDARGIPKGDVIISLLHDVYQGQESSEDAHVQAAVVRMRAMRKRQNAIDGQLKRKQRSPLPVDVDEIRVIKGPEHIRELESNALDHLERDELEEAWELYEEIVHSYRDSFLNRDDPVASNDAFDFRPYIGTSLHNIGILHFLNGSKQDFRDALRYFQQAADNRRSTLGETSNDYLTTMAKIALCHYALGDIQEAKGGFEVVIDQSKRCHPKMSDFMQISEILNNLGCISFKSNQPETALLLFRDALEIQQSVMKQSLYGGPKLVAHDTSMKISVIRSNIGYVKLVTNDQSGALTSFESALARQVTLLESAHSTVIATMDHLAVANLFAGDKEKAIRMLTRICNALHDAYGPRDARVMASRLKLNMVIRQENTSAQEIERVWRTTAPDTRNGANARDSAKYNQRSLK